MLRLFTFPTRINRALLRTPPAWLTYSLRRLVLFILNTSYLVLFFAAAAWWVSRVQGFPGQGGVPYLPNAPMAVSWPVFWRLPGGNIGTDVLFSLTSSVSALVRNTFPPNPPNTFAEMWVWLVGEVILCMMWVVMGACVVAVLFSPANPHNAYLDLIDTFKVGGVFLNLFWFLGACGGGLLGVWGWFVGRVEVCFWACLLGMWGCVLGMCLFMWIAP